MDERFMVAVFVAGTELQMAVEKETQVVLEAREDEMLIVRVAGKNDLVGVDVVFSDGGDLFRFGKSRTQCAQDGETGNAQAARGGKLVREKKSAPERDAGVDQTEQHRGAHQTEARHQQNRKEKGGSERAEIIEGKHVRDDVAKLIAVADDAHQQRNFKPDQNAHDNDQRVQNQFESLREGKRKHQQRGGKAADHAKQKFDPNEAIREATVYLAGKSAADAHREQIRADDGGELKDAVPDQIACERAGDKLVDEAASRDQQHGNEHQDAHKLVDRGSNDDADAQRHGADKNGERHVVLLHDLLPKMIRRELIHHHERDDEDEDSDKREDQCSDDIAEGNEVHLICLLRNGDSRRKPSGTSRDYRGRTSERF